MLRIPGIVNIFKRHISSERGTTFIETVVALVIISSVVVTFLSGLATASAATVIADKQAVARSLARGQLEWVKNVSYVYDATEYSPASIPETEDYNNYSVTITAAPLNNPDDGIQKVTIIASYMSEEVVTLECYKVDR